MGKTNRRQEFYWDDRRKMWRKKLKDPRTGKWSICVYGATKAELRENISRKQAELACAAEQSARPLVWQYSKQWYELNTKDLGQKRKDDYRNAINNHIAPIIGNMELSAVTLNDGLAIFQQAPPSKSAQQKIVTTLKRIFESAVDNGLIQRSPFGKLKAGGKAAEEKNALTREQQSALCSAVHGCSVETFVYLCLYAGLRREEALGLRWENVHLDAATPYLDVRTSCSWQGKNQAVVSDALKSAAAKRSVPIPPPLFACLSAIRADSTSEFVVCNQSGGAVSATGFRRMWEAVTRRTVREGYALGDKVKNHDITVSLDFHVTPHQLRHTYITELIMAGADIKTVQYLAGHATVQLTLNIYTHLMTNRPEDTAAQVLKAFGVQNSGAETTQPVQNP